MSATFTDENLWNFYAQAVAKAAGLPSVPDDMVLVSTALPANFAVGSVGLAASPSLKQALASLYQVADSEAHLEGIYDPTGGSGFSVYAGYIDTLTPKGAAAGPTPAQTAQLALLTAALTKAQTKGDTDLTAAQTAWNAQTAMFPGKYKDFQDFLNQSSWGTTLGADEASVLAVNSKIRAINNLIYGSNYLAIAQDQTVVDRVRTDLQGSVPSGPSSMLITTDAGDRVVPTYTNGTPFAAIAAWVDGVIAAGTTAATKSTTFTANSGASSFSASSFAAQTQWSVHRFFWSGAASASTARSAVSVDTTSSSFSLTIGFADIKAMPVTPGPWFDSSLLYALQNPGQVLVPTVLYLAMYPSFSLKMDAASYAAAKSAYTSSAGFGIGACFGLAGSGSVSSSGQRCNLAYDDTSCSVTLTPSDPSPVIVAMQMTAINDR